MDDVHDLTLSAEEPVVGVLSHAGENSLEHLTVPEGVAVIGAKAFSNCRNLHTLHLPTSLTHIEMKSFENCPLKDIYYAGSQAQFEKVEISPTGSAPITGARKHYAKAIAGISAAPECRDDREALFSQIRDLLKGGDGQLHIIAPDLCLEGALAKPGDMTLLIFPQGSTMLIDTGYFVNLPKVLEFLEGIGLTKLDYLVFSHSDVDHISNARDIAATVYRRPGGVICRFLWTGQAYGTILPDILAELKSRGVEMDLEVRAGRHFRIDGVTLDILGPTEADMQWDSTDGDLRNNQSMIMKFTYGKVSFLTCGDLYASHEGRVVSRWGETLRADIWKTNHHGCFTSNTDVWLDEVGGRIAFTCGNDNGDTVLTEKLRKRGVDYYSTGCHGTILISASMDGTCETVTQYHRGLTCSMRVHGANCI